MTNTQSFAARELDILSKTWDRSNPDEEPVILEFTPEILALCERFGNSGQSGGSAPFVAGAICHALKKLLLQKPIAPITGIDDEWFSPTEQVLQNNRCSAMFKDADIQDGDPYYLDAIIWKGDTEGESGNDWDTFTGTVAGITSRQFIKGFPFIPKKFYIDVTREELPADHTEEPFYEVEYYDQKIYEATGVKEWVKEKYRYKIKNPKQLEKVWKYYKQPKQ
jgi:hypothetical protein